MLHTLLYPQPRAVVLPAHILVGIRYQRHATLRLVALLQIASDRLVRTVLAVLRVVVA